MGSPITFSGFNQIDFSLILNAVMRQESRPLEALTAQKDTLQKASTNYSTLSTKLAAVRTAALALSGSSVNALSVSSSDPAALGVSASGAPAEGRHEIVVQDLARAQVTASNSTVPDADQTTVATGGTLTVGGVVIAVFGAVTLRGLAAQINEAAGIGVNASVSETAPGEYRLILTGHDSGVANAFTIDNALTGGTLAFAGNAVEASNASFLVNNLPVTSSSNTSTTAIDGLTLTLREADPDRTIVIEASRDQASLTEKAKAFATAFNDLTKFADGTLKAPGSLGRDAVMRSMRNEFRSALSAEYGSGTYTRLAEIGIGFSRTGDLTIDEDALSDALQDDPDAVLSLLSEPDTGAFAQISDLVTAYAGTGGYVADARTRLSSEISRINTRIADMESRLALRRQALQAQFSAADQAMTRLNSQSGSLSGLGIRSRL